MPPFRAVLFDLDGTLIDSVRLILDSYHHTLAAHGLPARSDQHWLEGMGTPLRAQFREWSDNPDQLEAMVLTYREYNLRHHDDRVAAYPGVSEMFQSLRRRGTRTALVTSKNREGALRGLRVTGLDIAIDVVVGADDVTRAKPDPEPVERALTLLGVEAGDTVFVGDSRHDIESGRSAGVATAAALWGPFDREHLGSAKPDHWLERPMDLLALMEH
jgi:pyrophosphatase PpaX